MIITTDEIKREVSSVHAMTVYREMEVEFCTFSAMAVNGGGCLTLRPERF
jgi:hypothetical protein